MKMARIVILAACLVFCLSTITIAADKVPADMASSLLMKLAAFEKNISSGGEITIHLMGAPSVASELKKNIGKSIGKSKITAISEGDKFPGEKPSILFLGDASLVSRVISYTEKNKVLSVTNLPELVKNGINLGIGVDASGKSKIYLNLTAASKENCEWNPAILKVAEIVTQNQDFVEEEIPAFLPLEDQPKMIGGEKSLMKKLKYPRRAERDGVQGQVVVQFVVTKEGKPSDFKVVKSLNAACDKASIDALKKVKFKPAKQNGKPVPYRVAYPIRFVIKSG